MVELWNANMATIFIASWVVCLDESMSPWLNRWTCPGWIWCPRKPWPFGNEWHSICCAISGIMFAIEILEGKDEPKEVAEQKKNKYGPTVGLLLRMTTAIYHSGRVVVLDSGFCVLQGLIELRKVGVFAHSVIKKRKFWPKFVPGEVLDDMVHDKNLGTC